MALRSRVVVYVERGDDLLVFDHRDHPEAGTQVPAGGVLDGEALEEAVVREVREETGVELDRAPIFLGTHEHLDGLGEPSLSHFFRVAAPDGLPEAWEHLVGGDGGDARLTFLCRFDAAPDLWPVQAVFRGARRPHPYDPQWPALFEEEAARLRELLAPWLVEDIHHVGSTSIPGMAAKPVIDMMAGVADLQTARDAFEPLRALDYAYREHRRDAHAFFKPPDAPTQWEETHHLHLTVPGSSLWRERLAFRDALRSDPALIREYTEWKLRHYGRAPTPGLSKRPFVERVLASAGVALEPDARRLTDAALARRPPS